MSVEIPADLSPQVSQLIADGIVQSENEAVAKGLELLLKQESLRRDVNSAIASLNRGEGLTEEEVFDDLLEELKQKIAAEGDR